jgi:WASH complex subunit 7
MGGEGKGFVGPGEEHLDKLCKFVADYGNDLRALEHALDETAANVWDANADVVGLKYDSVEECRVHALIDTDNKEMCKVMAVFAALSEECAALVQDGERDFFAPLSCFGERFDDAQLPEGEEMQEIARALPLIESLSAYAARCHAVLGNSMSQLAGLYTAGKDSLYQTSFKGVHLYYFVMRLADVVRVLITLDALVAANVELQEQWYQYKQVLQSAALEPEAFGMAPARIAKLLMAVTSLEAYIFNGAFLRGCWLQELPWHHAQGVSEVRANSDFIAEVSATLRSLIAQLSSHIGDATESTHRLQMVGLIGLVVVMSQVNRGRDFDSKLYKAAVQVSAKTPIIALYGRAVMVVAAFLQDSVPVAISKHKADTKLESKLKALVAEHDETLASQVQSLNLEVSAWMVRMESDFSAKVGLGEMLGTRCNLVIQGILLAYQVGNVGKLHLVVHIQTQTPIRQSNLTSLLQSLTLLKAIQHTFFRKSALIGAQMLHMQRFLQMRLLQILEPIASDLDMQVSTGRKGGWKVDVSKMHMSSAATVLTDTLRGPNTRPRRAVAQVAWDMLSKKQIREGDVDEVNLQLRKLELLGSLEPLVAAATDCSFLLSSRGLLPLFLARMRIQWKQVRVCAPHANPRPPTPTLDTQPSTPRHGIAHTVASGHWIIPKPRNPTPHTLTRPNNTRAGAPTAASARGSQRRRGRCAGGA